MNDFIQFWQHLPQTLSPVLVTIGPLQIRYYSLMYLAAFLTTYLLVTYRTRKEDYPYTAETVQDSFVWAILGLIIGGRLGYALFYSPEYYLNHPLSLIMPFDLTDGFRFVGITGMSYHGGLVGIVIAAVIFCRKRGIAFFNYADLFCPAIPLGYTFGRIGNFMNGELFGRATNAAWGMYFPLDPYQLLRHPSQLYEAFFEGIFLFAVLWSVRRKKAFDGFFLGLYLIGYGTVRFFIEFTREPDAQLGFILGSLSMGQLLCLAMILAGLGLWAVRRRAER